MNTAKHDALIPASFEYTDKITEESDTIELQLKRMAFNTASSKALTDGMESGDTAAVSEMLAGLIADWNLDYNGEPFPPTAENIGSRPADFVGQLSECVFKRLFPNPQRASNSPNGSEQKEKLASAATDSESDSNSPKPADSGE